MTLAHHIARGLALLAFLFGSLAVIQYWFLAAVALLSRKNAVPMLDHQRRMIAILIPAHNEESLIGQAVQSCMAMRYPKDQYRVYVVADNCTDRTANLAREHGATCIEREDPSRPGKGQAIRYALDQGILESADAVMILDADCEIVTNALEVADDLLALGYPVLQAKVTVGNPDESAVSYMMAVGNHIENELFYRARSKLGWIVLLRGTGMVFDCGVLERVPWQVGSNVEDSEFTIALHESGYVVRFMEDVIVRSSYPVSSTQMMVQRSRWSRGIASLTRRHAVRSVLRGLYRRRWSQVDLGQMLLIQSKPAVGVCVLLQLVLLIVGDCLAKTRTATTLVVVSCGLVVALLAYFALGIVHFGLSWRRIRLLAMTPVALLRLSMISIRAILGAGAGAWTRTPR